MAGLGMTVLVILGTKYLVQNRWDLLLQVGLSVVVLAIFIASSRKLHQDAISYLCVVLTALLHNLGLYGAHPIGISFDHYTHFLGGFTVAIVIDRAFQKALPRPKRLALLILSALAVGAVVEIMQWIDGYLVPGIELFQADEMSNSMGDMIYNGLGGITMGLVTLFRKTTIE